MCIKSVVVALCVISGASGSVGSSPPAPSPASVEPPLLPLLTSVANWIVALPGLAANNVSISHIPRSIFINGNLARTLLAAYRITNNSTYLSVGLAWCDTFADLQLPVTTSTGLDGGWWDTGYNDLFLADTGTAVVALSLCWWLAAPDAQRQARYETAMRRYVAFVSSGCVDAPAGGRYGDGCPPAGDGFILEDGSFGDGYYKGELNNFSYTIATATTGSAFFPAWWRLPAADHVLSRDALQAASESAARWIVGNRSADGRIPCAFLNAPSLACALLP